MADEKEQQGILNARERLAQISHHFLSDAESRVAGAATAPGMRVAVLDDPDAPGALPVEGLARILAARGRVVSMFDAAAGLVSVIRSVETPETPHAPDSAPSIDAAGGAGNPDTVLVMARHPTAHLAGCATVLLALPCEPAGMCRAYARIKPLMRSPGAPALGVTVTGAADRAAAQACFDKFARAALGFLGVRALSYGYLGAPQDTGLRSAELADIAELLLADWRAAAVAERCPRSHTVN